MVVFVIIRLHSMFFVIIALFRVFTKSMNHFGCFLTKLFDYIECLQSSTTTLCVVALSTRAVCMFSLMYRYFDCFSTIDISTLHVCLLLDLHWMFSQIECDHIACFAEKNITLHVSYKMTVPLWMFAHNNIYFVCWFLFKTYKVMFF